MNAFFIKRKKGNQKANKNVAFDGKLAEAISLGIDIVQNCKISWRFTDQYHHWTVWQTEARREEHVLPEMILVLRSPKMV